MNPSLDLINLLGWLTEPRETLILVYYKRYCKRYRWTARWQRRRARGMYSGVGGEELLPVWYPSFQQSSCVQLCGGCLNSVLLNFYRRFLQASWLNRCLAWPSAFLPSLPSPEVGEWGWKVTSLLSHTERCIAVEIPRIQELYGRKQERRPM